MHVQFKGALLALSMAVAGSSGAQGLERPPEAELSGRVYRCNLPSSIIYRNTPLPGVDCFAIGKYKSSKPINAAPPPGWIYLTSSAVADTYIQPSSIKRNAGKIGVWVMENYRSPQTNNLTRAPFRSAMRRLSVKCEDRQVTAQKSTFSSELFGQGEYVGEWRPLGAYGDFATPGSIDDAIAAYVCRSK